VSAPEAVDHPCSHCGEPGVKNHGTGYICAACYQGLSDKVRHRDRLRQAFIRSPSDVGQDGFPVLNAAAYVGPIGDLVAHVAPSTEATPAALLVSLLTLAGASLNRGPHVRHGSEIHRGNLYSALVGETARARKSLAINVARTLYALVDDGFTASRLVGGFGSGEALVWEVRDADHDEEDPGAGDTRAVVLEHEVGGVLARMTRQGATLSHTFRAAWDGHRLENRLNRKRPVVASEAHVAMLGAITGVELRASLTTTDAANGFGNRILWVATRRERVMPFGGPLLEEDATVLGLTAQLRRNLACRPSRVRIGAHAEQLWRDFYAVEAERTDSGLVAALTSRPEAQVLRVALVFAVSDGTDEIAPEHLAAAVNLWRYCETSARWIFGSATGDADADRMLDALRIAPKGLTREAMRDVVFGSHNVPARRVKAAADLLEQMGLAQWETEATRGRTAYRLMATPTDGDE
jgi:hypothetical protein